MFSCKVRWFWSQKCICGPLNFRPSVNAWPALPNNGTSRMDRCRLLHLLDWTLQPILILVHLAPGTILLYRVFLYAIVRIPLWDLWSSVYILIGYIDSSCCTGKMRHLYTCDLFPVWFRNRWYFVYFAIPLKITNHNVTWLSYLCLVEMTVVIMIYHVFTETSCLKITKASQNGQKWATITFCSTK